MELYFLRHGLADRSEWDGDDFSRPLTARGRDRIAVEAEVLRRIGFEVDLVVSSPLVRALQTAEIVAEAIGAEECLVVDDRLGPGFDAVDVRDIMQETSSATRILFVGHEPDFSRTIGSMIGGGEVVCKKGTLARVDVHDALGPAGTLVWLLPPRILAQRGL